MLDTVVLRKPTSRQLPKLFDIVELISARPDAAIPAGSVWTIVEELAGDAYVVEFFDDKGQTIALERIPGRDLALQE